MFPIRTRKLDNISVRQTYRWKLQFVGFLAICLVSRSNLRFVRNLQKSNDCSTTPLAYIRSKIAGVTCIVNERYGALAHPARLRMLAAARRDAALSPNYFGQIIY